MSGGEITGNGASIAAISAALLCCALAALALWNLQRRRMRRLIEAAAALIGDERPVRTPQALLQRIGELADLRGRAAQVHGLTGLPTREPLIARMSADGQGTLAIFALYDVNRLSAFDPELGDTVLRLLAHRMVAMIGTRRLLAQVDRSHLALWIGGAAEGAAAEIDALCYAMGDRLTAGEREIVPDIGLRRAVVADDGSAPELVLTRTLAAFSAPAAPADAAPIDLQAIARERYRLEQDLRLAVQRGEMRLDFQPLIDSATACVMGAEALIRWRHPVRGLVSPGQFVPIMEASGLAPEIGTWALNTAVRHAAIWRREGLGRLRIAVNVSGRQLEAHDLDRLVARTLARHGIGPDAIEIELTESVALGDAVGGRATFDALRAMGVRVAIDDFGTGYSSFSTLRTLAFDKIKIDREFVSGVEASRERQAICQSILALGRGLGIRVLAEGVERAEEVAWLHRHGCRHFQGYYFAAPLDPASFAAYVRDRDAVSAKVSAAIDSVVGEERIWA
ncbi:putative bifunctional diguanylate cyclase/phosphodiesterase [Sphingomonas spermidinifaciens]|nr:EAL domain-containing protein [Sphingomonas spermidinifaciens]